MLPEGLGVRASALCRLAGLRVREGRFEEAEQLLVGLEHHEDAVLPLVALHLARDEPALAAELLDRRLADGPHEDHVLAPLLAPHVEAQIAIGDLGAARRLSEQLTELVRDESSPYLRALAATARAQVCTAAGEGDARTCWHQAMTSYATARMPVEVAAVRLELARLSAADRPTVAVSEAQAALRVFEEVGDRRRADATAALLRSLGAGAPPGPRRDGDLTRREEDVLELIGCGLTNPEIGNRLFISPKTVEHHVSRILSKLGLRSRAEAAAYVARTGSERGTA
jgi:DNA-binding NarL/FixJ family response regulator